MRIPDIHLRVVPNRVKSALSAHRSNWQGWRTNRNIVVFASDDWGSIRMPSRGVYDKLIAAGIRVDKCAYNRYDSLATGNDLADLFGILTSFKDSRGSYPVITANCVMANPDFDKIAESGFSKYYYEPFTTSLSKYPGCENSFALWKQGMESRIFFPQFHGREHLQVKRWMEALRNGLPETRLAFDNRLFGISRHITKEQRKSYMAAFDADRPQDIAEHREIVADGLKLFREFFGFSSKSFIPPNYTWYPELEAAAATMGVEFMQGGKVQYLPKIHADRNNYLRHYTGEITASKQIHLVRNCFFEPSESPNVNWVESCMQQIAVAFLWRKPAIVSTHRLNFIGSIDEGNKERNLSMLTHLLRQALKKWPTIEFMNLTELGEIIKSSHEQPIGN